MSKNSTFYNSPAAKSTILGLFLLAGFVVLGMFAGQSVGLILASLLTGISLDSFNEVLQNPARFANAWLGLMLMQAGASFGGFTAGAWFYWSFIEKKYFRDFSISHTTGLNALPVLVVLVIGFMPFNALVIGWNKHLQLPEFMTGLENWMRTQEGRAQALTQYLTNFEGIGRLLIAWFVVGFVPALGEEITFRGIVQRLLYRAWGNPHLSIWGAAALFSAIHLQFYGFVPRLLLGAMFGYLYHWSRNIWIPIFAHFVNNSFTLLMFYLYRHKLTQFDVEKVETVPAAVGLTSLVVSVGLMWYFSKSATPDQEVP